MRLRLTHAGHINLEAVASDAELVAVPHVRCDLRAVNDVLARQACDVRTRAADVLAVDDRDALSFAGEGPRRKRRSRAAAQDHDVKLFRLRLLSIIGGWSCFRLLMRLFLSARQVHSWLALISRGRQTMLLPATVRSQLHARCAPSTVE